MSDLVDRCREVLEWHDTGFLKGDHIRNLARSKHSDIDFGTRMKMAEDQTAREAMAFVISNKDILDGLIKYVEEDSTRCDCCARESGECACGAWWGYKDYRPESIVNLIKEFAESKGIII